ncbi:hypothetical protein PPERSA_10052 [Pseudocohnilembus persalinus]|uniref:ER membrane protein complex subunit 4 n=1 Tax=Pseudocohnilembus persalinus TaxID=266149 RepID=A0A0V0QJD4_PSEPJ|nr:hypothetical protein PPERSA_10052 [Pseudocohnilembus persalinus]|eukprot:KRX02435.1 hypothetical protein PPERSA_10052 [Pseudocohnilembus persalinus]
MTDWEFKLNQNQKKKQLSEPFGYSKNGNDLQETEKSQQDKRKMLEDKIYKFATGDKSQFFMAIFMMYMTGGTLNIFTILFTFQFLYNPTKAIFSTNTAFQQFEGKGIPLLKFKLYYIGMKSLILSVALYKLYNLGLLPLSPSDWVDLVPSYQQNEIVFQVSK